MYIYIHTYIYKIIKYLWVVQELRLPPKWRMEWWCWPSRYQSISQLKFGLCLNSGLNSPLFSPFINMHVPFAQNFPKFAIQETLLWETFPVFYLLVPTNNKINNKSFLLYLAWLHLLTWHPPKGKPSFRVINFLSIVLHLIVLVIEFEMFHQSLIFYL